MFSGITGSSDISSSEVIEGRDSKIFFSDPTDAKIVNTTLITINNVAVRAVNLDNKLAEPLGDIIPPIPPPARRLKKKRPAKRTAGKMRLCASSPKPLASCCGRTVTST